ncbi:MAG: hypothetical protein JSV15_05425 [Candidatus Bathyarchaeota archaeon]|nr:MAG: hypothetical protein JSV15_05425 [Candidatus Bathyarchaeota archaeon]
MSEKEVKKCYLCGVEMQFAQKVPFRIKGHSGIWIWVFGELAELGEEMLSSDVYLCPKCGHIEMFADEKAKQFLLKMTPKAFLKKCARCDEDIPIASEECPYCEAIQKEKGTLSDQ